MPGIGNQRAKVINQADKIKAAAVATAPTSNISISLSCFLVACLFKRDTTGTASEIYPKSSGKFPVSYY
jgi:hypothetical protein